MLLPSVLGLALCMVCLAATTWAWFTASVTSEANTIQTASFEVAVTVNGNPVAADANGDYTLAAGDYTIMLKPTGTATKGFVVVEVAQQTSGVVLMMAGTGVSPSSATPDTTAAGTYCTPQLFDENGVPQVATFTLKTEGTVTLTPCWGEQKDYSKLSDKSVITATLVASDEAQLTNEEEDPADETQQEEEQENQQEEEKEKTPSDEQETPDGENPTEGEPPAEGEGEQPSDPANGENGQQGGEQQGDEPSTPTEGEGEHQGGETPAVSEGDGGENNEGSNTGDNTATGDDTSTDTTTTTGGESPTDTTIPAGGDVPTDHAPSE